jgi:ABC-type glycerol-3-phosphate transport system permease component
MNSLQIVLSVLGCVFLALWLRSPRHPQLALVYARWVLLGIVSVTMLAPFAWLLAACFKDRSVMNEYLFLPPVTAWSRQTLNLGNFERLLAGRSSVQGRVYFWQYLLNSTIVATVSTSVQLGFCSMAGYAFAKYEFWGKRVLLTYLLGSMTIPGALLLSPIYAIAVKWGLIDNLFGFMLPGLVSAYGIFLFRQACLAVPNELIEAGRIDGCSEFDIYLKLVMPLVRPMSAAFCLFAFLGNWNNFFSANVFLHSQDKLTLPVVLNLYLSQYEDDYGVFLAGTALAMVPPGLLFFALQREFIQGLTSGAVKG